MTETAPRVTPGVKALIEENGKILALKTENENGTYWVLPGGRVKYGEDPKHTLKREVKEELSANISLGKPAGMYYFFIGANDEGDQVVLTVVTATLAEEIDLAHDPSDENLTEYRWLTPHEFMELSDPYLREFLAEYYEK